MKAFGWLKREAARAASLFAFAFDAPYPYNQATMEATDSELMEIAKTDSRAFGELVSRYADRIFAFAFRLSGERALAEDALQETFIKVWKNRARFDASKSVKAWIFAIARNATVDLMRKRRDAAFSSLARASDDDAENMGERIADEMIDIPEAFDRTVLKKALEETLLTLTPDQRASVILHDVEGMTFEEIGAAMGKPMNTVKSHYRRAIIALRAKLEEKGHG